MIALLYKLVVLLGAYIRRPYGEFHRVELPCGWYLKANRWFGDTTDVFTLDLYRWGLHRKGWLIKEIITDQEAAYTN